MKKAIYYVLCLAAIVLIYACTTEDSKPATDKPTVTTAPAVKVNDTTYTCGGNVTAQGSSTVTDRGVVVSLDPAPTIDDTANDVKFSIGTGTGAFATNLAPFHSGYTYYIRAYAINTNGVAYGDDVTVVPTGGANNPDDDDDDTTNPTTGCTVVEVTGNIETVTTWTAGNVYVIDNAHIYIDAQLTIEAGVTVKFKGDAQIETWDDRIVANGTAENPIVFTSIKDDSYCGDSNGDGAATFPAKGDWTGIHLSSDETSEFTYCKILYAGKDGGSAVSSTGGNHAHPFKFDHCTFAHTATPGGAIDNAATFDIGYYSSNAIQTLTNNVFYDNDVPLYCGNRFTVDPSNIFHNPADASETNTRNCIVAASGAGSDITVLYTVTEVPYVLEGISLSGSDLFKVGANVIIKVPSGSGYRIGSQNASQMSIDPTAVFTSLRDDTHGGDTNGDGNTSSPAVGDWDGVIQGYDWYTTNVFYSSH